MPQQACFISVEQKSNQFHSFNLLFVKKKVHLLNLEITEKYVSLYCVFHSIRFKVNKRLAVWEDSLFYFILVSPPKKSVTAKNEKGKNQSKIACKNIGNAKVCFSRIRKHVCTRIFPYSYTYVQTCADVCMYNYMSKIKFHIKDKGVF